MTIAMNIKTPITSFTGALRALLAEELLVPSILLWVGKVIAVQSYGCAKLWLCKVIAVQSYGPVNLLNVSYIDGKRVHRFHHGQCITISE